MSVILNNQETPISTTVPVLSIGEIQLSADRRSSKETKLTDAERIRRAVLPANHWGELSASSNGNASQGLTDILRNALRDIGSARLKDALSENPMLRTIALSDYTVTALLSWNTETASSRGSITFTREDIEEWLPTSKIISSIKTTKGEQWAEFISKRLATLAAKNHGLKKAEDADKLVVLLADDSESTMGSELIQRLTHISKSLSAKKEENFSLDDL
jgi:hypothetical protein